MKFRIPRLPRAVAIVGKDGWPAQKFQQWWQSVAVGIEAAIKALDETITDITAILVRLGLVEVTADGALELADSAINPDGTIKTNKVVTQSIAVNNVTVGGVETPPDVFCPAFTPTVFIETSFMDVGIDASGQGLVSLDFTVDSTANHDGSAKLSYYVDTGSGWGLVKERVMGVTTDNGDSWWIMPGMFRFRTSAAQLRVRAVCHPGIWMPSAQGNDMHVRDIIYTVFGGLR